MSLNQLEGIFTTMIGEFITFVEKMFPMDPYTAEKARTAIRQFELKKASEGEGQSLYQFFMPTPFPYLSQGDIIDNVPFQLEDPDTGEIMLYRGPGMLLSNTCDAERDPYIVISPLLELDKMYGKRKKDFSTNLTYNLLYFPDSRFSNYIIDLTIMNTFSRKIILQNYETTASLNQIGYYLFLCKLTVQLMRPEDEDVQAHRSGAS
ncbi:hypothetical protein ACLIBG_13590 [Virgibacillus sp. W0181]|uniref:hypothetical protein n=1 Tax=Virgibacillus sp. W0181 TaxID=3391581 RepID=UPI003F46582A